MIFRESRSLTILFWVNFLDANTNMAMEPKPFISQSKFLIILLYLHSIMVVLKMAFISTAISVQSPSFLATVLLLSWRVKTTLFLHIYTTKDMILQCQTYMLGEFCVSLLKKKGRPCVPSFL